MIYDFMGYLGQIAGLDAFSRRDVEDVDVLEPFVVVGAPFLCEGFQVVVVAALSLDLPACCAADFVLPGLEAGIGRAH